MKAAKSCHSPRKVFILEGDDELNFSGLSVFFFQQEKTHDGFVLVTILVSDNPTVDACFFFC